VKFWSRRAAVSGGRAFWDNRRRSIRVDGGEDHAEFWTNSQASQLHCNLCNPIQQYIKNPTVENLFDVLGTSGRAIAKFVSLLGARELRRRSSYSRLGRVSPWSSRTPSRST
jgi:hypothetical protein